MARTAVFGGHQCMLTVRGHSVPQHRATQSREGWKWFLQTEVGCLWVLRVSPKQPCYSWQLFLHFPLGMLGPPSLCSFIFHGTGSGHRTCTAMLTEQCHGWVVTASGIALDIPDRQTDNLGAIFQCCPLLLSGQSHTASEFQASSFPFLTPSCICPLTCTHRPLKSRSPCRSFCVPEDPFLCLWLQIFF